jgi:hypothetical protein
MWQALRSLATAEHGRILKQEVTSVNLSRMWQALRNLAIAEHARESVEKKRR